MCFQSRLLGFLLSLLPNAPENNPTVFSPQFSGNDLTTARKRNVKNSLELFVTSEHIGGPCASASLDIPEHTQLKLPTAGVKCCLAPTPKQTQKLSSPPSHPHSTISGSFFFFFVFLHLDFQCILGFEDKSCCTNRIKRWKGVLTKTAVFSLFKLPTQDFFFLAASNHFPV